MKYTVFFHCCALVLIVFTLFCGGCERGDAQRGAKEPEVSVQELAAQNVPLTAELSGRVSAYRRAEVRPQVSGILQRQLFTEGSLVKEGQSLYKIDPATYEAAVARARATLARAAAQLTAATQRRARCHSLLGSHAVSKQDMEEAEAAYLQALADVEVAKAALRTAEIELRYTDVLAPITGRIGKSRMTQGALVTANQTEPLAVIQQLDPVYVDMTRSSLALLKLRDRYAAGSLSRPGEKSAAVRLRLETQKEYPAAGELQFSDITVDESTGMVLLRAVFPNPDGVLLPGMYVRAIVNEGVEKAALLVPQRAVRRNARGVAMVFVLGKDGIIEERPVEVRERVGRNWIVGEGLSPGEKVVVDGLRRLHQGDHVRVKATLPAETGASSGSAKPRD
ncbi:MAG: efflux RND transporter periplasmic adaptor subunit [Desulfovibrio sp.]|nr:efflux RND transporter periplasmic adaptor subunit [Desulfovibrio sp.]